MLHDSLQWLLKRLLLFHRQLLLNQGIVRTHFYRTCILSIYHIFQKVSIRKIRLEFNLAFKSSLETYLSSMFLILSFLTPPIFKGTSVLSASLLWGLPLFWMGLSALQFPLGAPDDLKGLAKPPRPPLLSPIYEMSHSFALKGPLRLDLHW